MQNEYGRASLHTEIAVLGAMLLDPVAINDATARLSAGDFSLASHRRIYDAMVGMQERSRPLDFLTLQDELERRKELDAIGGPAYLAYLTEGIPRNLNIESYVRIIKDESMARDLEVAFDLGLTRIRDRSEEALVVLSETVQQILEIGDQSHARGFAGVGEVVAESFGSLDKLYEQGREVSGLRTHFVDFDKMTSGLQPSELIIIAGRPSMGKTAICMNIVQNAGVRDGKVVGVFSLEMSREALLKRMLAGEATVNARQLQTGFIARDVRPRLENALERLLGSQIFIDDTAGITLTEMRAKCRRLKQQQGELDLVVVDYLQLMDGASGGSAGGAGKDSRRPENRTQEVSAISRGLKALAKELRCPVVALSQLSRASEQRGGDHKPMLSDLRESGSIEQDADVVAFIHRAEFYDRDNEELKGRAELIIAKQRNGPIGTVNLAYLESFTRFENLVFEGAY